MRVILVPDVMVPMRWDFCFYLNLLMGEILIDTIAPPVYHSLVSEERINNSMTVEFPEGAHKSNSWNLVCYVSGGDGVSEIQELSQNLLTAKAMSYEIYFWWGFKSIVWAVSR